MLIGPLLQFIWPKHSESDINDELPEGRNTPELLGRDEDVKIFEDPNKR